jgi:protein phosphatase 1 regulatory subunit 11
MNGSVATTMTTTETEPAVTRVVLKAKPKKKGVKWAPDTVDNENAGKKSSKKCCIYHKPKGFFVFLLFLVLPFLTL